MFVLLLVLSGCRYIKPIIYQYELYNFTSQENSTSGSFFLAENEYFKFYIKNNGQIHLIKRKARKCSIIFTKEKPIAELRYHNASIWNNTREGMLDAMSCNAGFVVLYIPENTIMQIKDKFQR